MARPAAASRLVVIVSRLRRLLLRVALALVAPLATTAVAVPVAVLTVAMVVERMRMVAVRRGPAERSSRHVFLGGVVVAAVVFASAYALWNSNFVNNLISDSLLSELARQGPSSLVDLNGPGDKWQLIHISATLRQRCAQPEYLSRLMEGLDPEEHIVEIQRMCLVILSELAHDSHTPNTQLPTSSDAQHSTRLSPDRLAAHVHPVSSCVSVRCCVRVRLYRRLVVAIISRYVQAGVLAAPACPTLCSSPHCSAVRT